MFTGNCFEVVVSGSEKILRREGQRYNYVHGPRTSVWVRHETVTPRAIVLFFRGSQPSVTKVVIGGSWYMSVEEFLNGGDKPFDAVPSLKSAEKKE